MIYEDLWRPCSGKVPGLPEGWDDCEMQEGHTGPCLAPSAPDRLRAHTNELQREADRLRGIDGNRAQRRRAAKGLLARARRAR